MKTALICVLVAYLIPYFCIVLAKSGKGMDNCAPRLYLEKLTGWRQRAYWAQLNNFENFAPFAFAVLAAVCLQANAHTVNILAVTFVGLRVLHAACYLTNASALRSLVWFAAQVCIVWLFTLSIRIV